MITFLVSGLWHGAGWTFVFWGALHGSAHIPLLAPKKPIWELERNVGEKMIPSPRHFLQMLSVFVFITFCWIFFRAENFASAWGYIGGIVDFSDFFRGTVPHLKFIALSFGLLLFEWVQHTKTYALDIERFPVWLRWIIYYGLLLILILFGAVSDQQQFIYFQF